MRGKVQYREAIRSGERITPAYAGKSIYKFQRVSVHQDHPRLCGEKLTPSKIYGIN